MRRRDRRTAVLVVAALAVLAIGIAIGSRLAPPQKPASPAPEVTPAPPGPARATVAPTPAGAVAAAAASITAFDGDVLLDPARLRSVVSRLASAGSRDRLLAAFADASAQTRAKLAADTAPEPVILLRSIPVGYRLERFSPQEATVAVWYVGIVGSGATVDPQQSWRTQTVTLTWEDGAWKVSSFASSAGPTPPLSTAEADPPADLFTSIPSFQEFDRVAP